MLRKRMVPFMLVLVLLLILLAGCGTKSSDDVVGALQKKMRNLESYSAQGTLTLQTGQTPQEYDVEVWHKKPDYYRIALTNRERNITQIVLRNEEGVFVLTPHLNKSFRFQSGWPDNHGQIYLFESLTRSILDDQERKFAAEKDSYIFEVKANYQNHSLASQKIWLTKDTLAPQRVQVMDTDYKVLVELAFTDFRFGVKFDDDAFDMDRNMTGMRMESIQTLSQADEPSGFYPIIPSYTPVGVYQTDMDEITDRADGPAIVLKYDGEYQYTIIEEMPKEKMVIATSGDMLDLGFTIGVVTKSGETKTLRFTHDGIDYTLLTRNLPMDEMQKVASSVFGQVGK